jgi:hypothetical protein
MVSSSSRYLLSIAYNRCIISPEQVIGQLTHMIFGDTQFQVRVTELLPKMQAAMNRYLRGTGYPTSSLFDDLVKLHV